MPQKTSPKRALRPAQKQNRHPGCGKLEGKVALITAVKRTIRELGRVDILVNNAAEQPAFTRSLSQALSDGKIRVNGVARGPIWTPLIPSVFPADKVKEFGADAPMCRAGEPVEVAPSFVFLASPDAAYLSGQVLHPNGGEIVNG